MIFKLEAYSKLCESLLNQGVPKDAIVDFDTIQGYLNEMVNINTNKEEVANLDSEHLTLSYLFALRWGIISLGISKESINKTTMALQSFFVAISNTIMSIIKLAIDGFDYQAVILTRSLYELCFTLLAIIIEPSKREALIKGAEPKNSYNIWDNHFRFKHLEKIIANYEKKVSSIELEYEFYSWRKKNYKAFSKYVHNNYLPLLLYGYANPKSNDENEILKFNLWGAISSRLNIITEDINMLLWYTELVFEKLLGDKAIDLNPGWFCKNEEEKEIWRLSIFIGILTKEYYLQIRMREEGKE